MHGSVLLDGSSARGKALIPKARLRSGWQDLASCRGRQAIGLNVALSPYVGNSEFERAGQFAANPIERIQALTAAAVGPQHLADDNLGIGIDVQLACFQIHGALQSFKQGKILGNVVVLVTDPFSDGDAPGFGTINDYANASRSRVAARAAVNVRN